MLRKPCILNWACSLLPPALPWWQLPFSLFFSAWIGSLLIGCSLGVGPLTGGVINRFGCRVAAVSGCLLFSLGMCLSSFATSIFLMYFTYGILCAFGLNFVLMSSMVIVAKYFKKWQSAAVAFSSAGIGIGTAAMSAVLQGLLDVVGWRHALQVVSGVVFLQMVLVACIFNPNVSTDDSDDTSSQHSDSRPNYSSHRCLSIEWSVCRQPFVLIMIATTCVSCATRITPYVHLVSWCQLMRLPVIVLFFVITTYYFYVVIMLMWIAWYTTCSSFNRLRYKSIEKRKKLLH